MAFIFDQEIKKITDPERNIILISGQGYSSGDKDWIIKWGQETIKFQAKDTKTYGGERQNTPIGIDWYVSILSIPETLEDKRTEIMDIIREALEAQWINYGWKGHARVAFHPRLERNVANSGKHK